MSISSGRVLLIDIDSCVRCHACEIACRQEHELTDETASCWCHVVTVGPRRVGGKLHMDFVPVVCRHCDDPACAAACPEGAIRKTDTGLVLIDEAACNGCKTCLYSCPYGCISFNEAKHTVGHCDQCRDRTESGLEPACVQHCIGGALQFISSRDLEERTAGQHTLLSRRVCYVSGKWKLQGNM